QERFEKIPRSKSRWGDLHLHQISRLEIALERDEVLVVLEQVGAALEDAGGVRLGGHRLSLDVDTGAGLASGLVPDDRGERAHCRDAVEEEADLHLAGLVEAEDDLSLSGEAPLDVALVSNEATRGLVAHGPAPVAGIQYARTDEVVATAATPTQPHRQRRDERGSSLEGAAFDQ